MKTKILLIASLILGGMFSAQQVQAQSCDTLRNYIPPSNGQYTVYVNDGDGVFLGQDEIDDSVDDYNVAVWAEPYFVSSATEIRGLTFMAAHIANSSGNGSVTFNVYANAGGEPGSIIGSQVVDFDDLTPTDPAGQYLYWDEVEFDNPVSVSGNFFVGYELSYSTVPADTFALATTVAPSNYTIFLLDGPAGSYFDGEWMAAADVYSSGGNPIQSAFVLNLLTSNGTAPVADFDMDTDEICKSGVFNVDASASTGTIDTYTWFIADYPVTTIHKTVAGGAVEAISPEQSVPASSQQALFLQVDGACTFHNVGYLIDVYENVSASVTVTDATCGANNGSIQITNATGGSGAYLYSIDGGVNTTTSGSFTDLSAGTYNVIVSTPGDGCSYTESVVVGGGQGEVLTIATPAAICEGESVEIIASGNGTIEWSLGGSSIGTGTSLTVNPSTTTTYDVVLTDANGCEDAKQVTVTVNQIASADFSYSASTVCAGGANEIPTVLNPGGSFSVSPSGLLFTDNQTGEIDMDESTEGVYVVTYTISDGTCFDSESFTITITSAPDASFTYSSNEFCGGSGVISPIFGAGASGGTFTAGTGLSISSNGDIDLGASTPGTYTVTNDIAASGTCPASSETFEITISSAQDASFSYAANAYCQGEGVVSPVLAAGATAGTFSADAGLSISNNGDIDLNASTAGTYTVTNTIAASGSCPQVSETFEVTINALPTVTVSENLSVCDYDGIIALTGESPTGGTYSGNGVTGNSFDPEVAGVGSHTITYTYVDGNGCENSATLTVEVDGCLGIETDNANTFVIAPNPASDYITVTVAENNTIRDIQLISLDGKVITTEITTIDSSTLKVDVSSIAKGTYLIQLISENGQSTKKVVIQ